MGSSGFLTRFIPVLFLSAMLFATQVAYAHDGAPAPSDDVRDSAAVEALSADDGRAKEPVPSAPSGEEPRVEGSIDEAPDAGALGAQRDEDAGGDPGDEAEGEGAHRTLVQGWNFFDGIWYWADADGAAARTGWLYDEGSWYWLSPEADGAMLHHDWLDLDGARYYLGDGGAMDTGWIFVGTDWYLAGEDGALRMGWAYDEALLYRLDPENDGRLCVGFFDVDDERYCALPGGAVAVNGWFSYEQNRYYADSTGALARGWIDVDGRRFWLDPETCAAATGLLEQDGKQYWLDESGAVSTGSFILDGELRFADESGVIVSRALGWQSVAGEKYYIGERGIPMTGWFTDEDGLLYFFDDGGVMCTGWLYHEGSWYLLSYGGSAASGWHTICGLSYWLDPETYEMAIGWVFLDDAWYYFDGSGAMQTGWLSYAGSWYYCRDDGTMATGWQYIGGSWYWFDDSGAMSAGGWLCLDDGWYWLYDSGVMATGWINVGGQAYKLDSSGRWVEDTGNVLGVSRSRLVNWLLSHEYDGYYLGTPYSSGFSLNTCLYPNGSRRWDGFAGMNCTGFVAHAYGFAGGAGELDAIGWTQGYSPWPTGPGGGSYINAWRWYGYAVERGAEMYTFDSVASMLASGKADKGDIIFFKTNGAIDCHIGFFWGDTPYENCMWHQIYPQNCISACFNNANKAELYQQTVLIKGF